MHLNVTFLMNGAIVGQRAISNVCFIAILSTVKLLFFGYSCHDSARALYVVHADVLTILCLVDAILT